MSNIQQFDFLVDLLRALLWQYNSATNLQGVLEQKQAWYDSAHSSFWADWHRDVFNLDTANDFGLSVWAVILDLPITITEDTPILEKPVWGFSAFNQNFTRGNFLKSSSGIISLSTEDARNLLRMRYVQLTTSGNVSEINALLARIYPGGAYVLDNLDMTCTYVFTFELPARVRYAFEKLDVLPRPSGVGIEIITPALRTFVWNNHSALTGGWNNSRWS